MGHDDPIGFILMRMQVVEIFNKGKTGGAGAIVDVFIVLSTISLLKMQTTDQCQN